MLNQLQIRRYSHPPFASEISNFVENLQENLLQYAQSQLIYRRNANLSRFQTTRLIALLVWQAGEGISSQRRFA